MIQSRTIRSIAQFVTVVTKDARAWEPAFPWFRGEPGDVPTPLTPRVFRAPRQGLHFDENNLLQTFRRRAHLFGLPIIPPREATDQWLFLARHVGLPTRLLDWTEGALIALYFALCDSKPHSPPIVWMLNPYQLNRKTADEALPNVFPLTWYEARPGTNPAFANIKAAWELGQGAVQLPVAIEPTTIHPRMNAQHSYFTVHGREKDWISDSVGADCLRKYNIELEGSPHCDKAFRELRFLGIARSTILPDAEALSEELSQFLTVADEDKTAQ